MRTILALAFPKSHLVPNIPDGRITRGFVVRTIEICLHREINNEMYNRDLISGVLVIWAQFARTNGRFEKCWEDTKWVSDRNYFFHLSGLRLSELKESFNHRNMMREFLWRLTHEWVNLKIHLKDRHMSVSKIICKLRKWLEHTTRTCQNVDEYT